MRQNWSTLGGMSNIELIKKEAWRIVEDQFRSTTRKMVDTVAEHELLEQMIEDDKPKLKYYGDEASFKGLHYLLLTPFRYPSPATGTRFGKGFERNIFYATLELKTAMCEKAFHRLDFLLASDGNIGGKSVNCTAFKVNVNTKLGIDLCKEPFASLRNEIASPISYKSSQELGSAMRKDGVEAFISYSARSKENGKNLNIFTPNAFGEKKSIEKTFQIYSCYSTKDSVEFYSNYSVENAPVVFKVKDFLVDGQFPAIRS